MHISRRYLRAEEDSTTFLCPVAFSSYICIVLRHGPTTQAASCKPLYQAGFQGPKFSPTRGTTSSYGGYLRIFSSQEGLAILMITIHVEFANRSSRKQNNQVPPVGCILLERR